MESSIRDLVNSCNLFDNFYAKKLDLWRKLCVSMDTVGDTDLAINEFMSRGTRQNYGTKYLCLYGVLQAVYLQQDAIESMFESLSPLIDVAMWSSRKVGSAWEKIRKYRNLTTGHPVECRTFERGRVKRAFVSRVSISSKCFEIRIYDQDNVMYEAVDLDRMLQEYLKEATGIIDEISSSLKINSCKITKDSSKNT